MVKKTNKDAIMVKELLNKGWSQKKIAKLLKISKQKVNYWTKHEIKSVIIRKSKLNAIYKDRIIRWAKNKPTSSMSCRKIAQMINSVLEKKNERDAKGKIISITYKTVNNILKKHYGKPKKVRKVFFLSKKDKDRRYQFCQSILKRNINYDEILFTDESKISLGSYTHDYIRLDPLDQKKLKEGKRDIYSLLNRAQHKYEQSLIIAGGISYYGATKLIIVDGTMNNFAYGQTLLFYEEDMKKIEEKFGKKLILEQDGATAHTCKISKLLLEKLFTKNGWIQNPPNSPDLAYPIEDLWGIIKPRIKRRNPTSLEELKKFLIEEWNSIPLNLAQNLCVNYLERIKKVFDLHGERLEPEDLRKYKKNTEQYIWDIPNELPKIRYVYNNDKINLIRKAEIKNLRNEAKNINIVYKKKIKEKKETKQLFKKRGLKNMAIGLALSITNGPEITNQEKEKALSNIEKEIEVITNMSLWEYINHLKEKERVKEENMELKNDKESINSDSTLEEIVDEKLRTFEKLIKDDERLKFKKGNFKDNAPQKNRSK